MQLAKETSVAIILVSTDGHAGFLPGCLESLPQACEDLPFRVILVDNDGDSESCKTALQYQEKIPLTCVAQEKRKGFAANVSDALNYVSEPYVLLLNVDTVLPAGSIRRTVRTLEKNPGLGALTVRMRGRDGKLQASARAFPYPSVLLWEQLNLSRMFPTSRWFGRSRLRYVAGSKITEIDWGSGAYLLLRRQALEEVGGLDTGFHMYSEDTDLCYRLWQHGWRVAVDPSVEIFHWKDPLASARRREAFVETHASLLRFWEKHGGWFRRAAVRSVLLLGLTGRFLTLPLLFRRGRSFAFQSAAAYWEVWKMLLGFRRNTTGKGLNNS